MVLALGAKPAATLGVNFLLGSSSSIAGDSRADAMSLGVFLLGEAAADALEPSSSSSSSPNDNLTFGAGFRFFVGGCGVEALHFGCQFYAPMLPSGSYRSAGVDAPETGVALPELCPSPSRSFTSSASARLLRKSERLTRPTV